MSKVFVSYKGTDKDKVFLIVRWLESELGSYFWIDKEGIQSNERFSKVIVNAINKCEVFLFTYSKAHEKIDEIGKDWAAREVLWAEKKEKRIVFIELENCQLPDELLLVFPNQEVVKANDEPAMLKLVKDIRGWLHLTQPDNHQAIDLGLPSGTKWASCNVGAAKPEAFGNYFAWGELGVKNQKVFNWKTYIHCEGDKHSIRDLGRDISGTKYDAAHMKWESNWRMPTVEDFKELLKNCTGEWAELNGVNGYNFTSRINGNSIFMPASGRYWNGIPYNVGRIGYYWSSLQGPSESFGAYNFYFKSDKATWDSYSILCNGFTIRPIIRIR